MRNWRTFVLVACMVVLILGFAWTVKAEEFAGVSLDGKVMTCGLNLDKCMNSSGEWIDDVKGDYGYSINFVGIGGDRYWLFDNGTTVGIMEVMGRIGKLRLFNFGSMGMDYWGRVKLRTCGHGTLLLTRGNGYAQNDMCETCRARFYCDE